MSSADNQPGKALSLEEQLQSLHLQLVTAQGKGEPGAAGGEDDPVQKEVKAILDKIQQVTQEYQAQLQKDQAAIKADLAQQKADLEQQRQALRDEQRLAEAREKAQLRGDRYTWDGLGGLSSSLIGLPNPSGGATRFAPSNLANIQENEDEDEQEDDDPFQDLTADQKVEALTKALAQTFRAKPTVVKSSAKEHESAKLSDTTPENWITFKDNFLTTAALNEWTDSRAKLKLKAALRDDAAKAVQHISIPEGWSLDRLLLAYEEVFIHPAGVDLAQAELERAKKKSGETLLAFHTRLRYLFIRAYPREQPEHSKRLKDLFSTQLGSLAMSKELRTSPSYRAETYTGLLTRAQDIEAAFQTLQEAYKGHRGVHALLLQDEPETTDSEGIHALGNAGNSRANDRRSRAGGPPRCHACDSEDHLLRQCPLGKKVLDAVKSAPHKFGLAKKKPGPRNSKGSNGVNAIHDQPASGN